MIRIRRHPVLLSIVLLLGGIVRPVSALDLTLNGKAWRILPPWVLIAVSRSDANTASSIHVNALFPYLESVSRLEIQSEETLKAWEQPGLETWESARLVYRIDHWEIHVGGERISDPERIAIWGMRSPVEDITVWSAVADRTLREKLEMTLSFRGIRLSWRQTVLPGALLEDPPLGRLPDLVVLDDLDLIRLGDSFVENQVYSSDTSRVVLRDDVPENVPALALNALSLDGVIPLLPGGAAALYAGEGSLSTALEDLLKNLAADRDTGVLLVTENPRSALDEGRTRSALLDPFSGEFLAETPIAESVGGHTVTPLLRRRFLAIPAGAPNPMISRRLMSEISKNEVAFTALPLPNDVRVPRLYEVYKRIGRLVLSGQLSSKEAVILMLEAM